MATLSFFDIRTRKTFRTDKFTVRKLNSGRLQAVTKSPSGAKSFKFLPKGFKK